MKLIDQKNLITCAELTDLFEYLENYFQQNTENK